VLTKIRDRFTVLVDDRHTEAHWLTLVTGARVMGKRAHDARIAALMKTHGIRRLLTLNPSDFTGFELDTLGPD
jgi:predicted nucleic acid-binding protein